MNKKIDPRTPYYKVFEVTDDVEGKKDFRGFAPMGCANVARVNKKYVIDGTKMLSPFALKEAKRDGMIIN